jgi:CDP-diacylglycerol--glycerol-3-phosphate 3-phosphatidyltransferase
VRGMKNMNLANKLTLFRIILVPVILIIPFLNIQGDILGVPITYLIIDIIFILASITDKLDGHIARSRNQITTFGKFLDPIADKILVIVAMLILVEAGRLPAWIPAIVVIREFIVSGYRLVAVEKSGKVIAASIWGKIKTCTQMIGLVVAFIDVNSFGAIFSGNLNGVPFVINLVTTILLSISVIATIFSGIDYLKGSKDLFKGEMK